MKKILVPLLILIVIGALIIGGCAPAAPTPAPAPAAPTPAPTPIPKPEPIVLKTTTFLPRDTVDCDGFKMYVEMLNERAKGELIIQYLGGPEVIPMFEQPEAVGKGVLDAAWVPAAYYRAVVPEANTIMLTHLDPWEERESGLYDYMVELHKEKMNVRVVGRQLMQQHFVFGGKPRVDSPSKLSGLKMRAGALYDFIQKDLGIVGVTISQSETYAALEKGVLDAFSGSLGNAVLGKWYEVTDYIYTPLFWAGQNVLLLVNLDKWNSIPKNLQDLMLDVQIELEPVMYDNFKKVDSSLYQKLLDGGMERSKWSAADDEWFLEHIDKVQWQVEKERLGAEEVAKLQKLMGY